MKEHPTYRWNKPFESGELISASTSIPPTEYPMSVTQLGSPPNSEMCSWTHFRAYLWIISLKQFLNNIMSRFSDCDRIHSEDMLSDTSWTSWYKPAQNCSNISHVDPNLVEHRSNTSSHLFQWNKRYQEDQVDSLLRQQQRPLRPTLTWFSSHSYQ